MAPTDTYAIETVEWILENLDLSVFRRLRLQQWYFYHTGRYYEVKYVPFYTPPVVIREPYRPYTWTVTVGDTHCFTTSSFDIGQFSAQSSNFYFV